MKVGKKQEYGKMEIHVEKPSGLFGSKNVGSKQVVWMSHGDEAVKLPHGFEVVARSEQGSIAALENPSRKFYGLQYHPEVNGFITVFGSFSALFLASEHSICSI